MHSLAVMAHVMAYFQQQREHQLRDRLGAVVRHVAYSDAPAPGFIYIHHIVARRQHADVAKVRAGGQCFFRQGRLIGEDDARFSDPADDILSRRPVIDSQFPKPLKALPA